MKGEIERMEINYTLYFFAFFEKVIKKTIDILLLEKNSRILKNSVRNKKVKLSEKEYILLSYFVENYDQVLSKEQITIRIWGYDTDVEYNNEEVYISFLRKKLKFIGTDTVIETVRGVGYRLRGKNDETV